jgi:hypothetical protein
VKACAGTSLSILDDKQALSCGPQGFYWEIIIILTIIVANHPISGRLQNGTNAFRKIR